MPQFLQHVAGEHQGPRFQGVAGSFALVEDVALTALQAIQSIGKELQGFGLFFLCVQYVSQKLQELGYPVWSVLCLQ
jgi:hypothetical protein